MTSTENGSEMKFPSCITLLRFGVVITLLALIPRGNSRFVDTLTPRLQEIFKDDFLKCWEPPKELKEKLPYVLSGYDYEGRPVWLMELGKWKLLSFVDKDEKEKQEVQKYVLQVIHNILRSVIRDNNETAIEEQDTKFRFILDMDGFTVDHLTHVKDVPLIPLLHLMEGMIPYCEKTYVLNVGYVVKTLIQLVRPILAQGFPLMESYGSNRALWRSALLKDIPADQLPEWYGGQKGFKPLKVYG